MELDVTAQAFLYELTKALRSDLDQLQLSRFIRIQFNSFFFLMELFCVCI